jgi:mono/diheme cytochrome c family protein
MTVHTTIETRSRGIPGWALGLTVFILLVGGVYLAGNLTGENPPIALPSPSGGAGGPGGSPGGSPGGGDNTQRAIAIVDEAGCQSCHGPDLAGSGAFPSLHDVENGPISENLQDFAAEHPDDWAEIWIAGTDPAVSDPAMRGGMPAFAAPPYELSDEEIAMVVEYLKSLP